MNARINHESVSGEGGMSEMPDEIWAVQLPDFDIGFGAWTDDNSRGHGDRTRYILAATHEARGLELAKELEFQADCMINLLGEGVPPRISFQRDLIADLRKVCRFLRGEAVAPS